MSGFQPVVTTKNTTTRKKVTGEVTGLQMRGEDGARTSSEYAEIRAEQVEKRFDRNPKLQRLQKEETLDNGSLRVFDPSTGKYHTYPESRDIPGLDGKTRLRDEKTITSKSDLKYRLGVVEGTIEPPDSAKGPDYNITKQTVSETVPVTSSNVQGTGGSNDNTEADDGESGETDGVTSKEVLENADLAKVYVNPEIDGLGDIVEGTGGDQYLTKDEVKALQDQGRISASDAKAHKKRVDSQLKALAAGNWPLGENTAENQQQFINPHTGILTKGTIDPLTGEVTNTETNETIALGLNVNPDDNRPDLQTRIANSVKPDRVAKGIAGVPSDHKIRLYSKTTDWFEGTLRPLIKTGHGITFPYTPTINVNHTASYGTYDINQSVNQPHYYMMTPNISLSVTAIFTANTAEEASYLLAAMHFFRTVTKSDFGAYVDGVRRTDAGTPPPVLVFSGYGDEMFNNIPVVVRNVNFTLPEDVDYVSVVTQESGSQTVYTRDGEILPAGSDGGGGMTAEGQTIFNAGAEGDIVDVDEMHEVAIPGESSSVPTSMLFAFDIAPQYPPSRLRDEWNLKKYASGDLLKKGYI